MPPTVAIIMRAKDEMPHVQRVLTMLEQQTFRAYHLFAVDSGSTDGTLQRLQDACPVDRLERIKPEEYIPGRVLNRAIAQTDHDLIVLLNADAVPCSTDFLDQLLHPLQTGRADAVFAKQVARTDAHFIVAYDYARAYADVSMPPGFFSAVACAFRRELWQRHPFREHGFAEDLAWAKTCAADGARFQFVPGAAAEHSHNYTLKALYRKRKRQAATFDQTANLFRQIYLCLREIVRDTFHAIRTFKLQTMPYNIAYRVTIHAAIHKGLKKRGT